MSHYQHRRPNQKYTHFDNEITGEYYKENQSILTWTLKVIGAFCTLIVVVLIVADMIWGAETVTNFIADLFTF